MLVLYLWSGAVSLPGKVQPSQWFFKVLYKDYSSIWLRDSKRLSHRLALHFRIWYIDEAPTRINEIETSIPEWNAAGIGTDKTPYLFVALLRKRQHFHRQIDTVCLTIATQWPQHATCITA